MLVVDAQIHLWHQNLPTNAAHRQITSWSAEDCLKEMAATYLPQVAQIAERHPGLKLIIDHLGRARGGQDDAAFANIAQVCALAKFPNVALKATGAAGESSQPYPFTNIHNHLRQLYDAFGPQS